ncbi:hypothetical protein BGZ79_006918 [Entomortierella chlamydospora]|nr:hypothetical protein BGZ79_006918 [Entomortierella chlamydospora]
MPIRPTSSAKNLRDQFKGSNIGANMSSIDSPTSGISRSKTLEPAIRHSKSGLLRTSSGGGSLRRVKSFQKKGKDSLAATLDLSMEVTLVIVKRCVKEIRLTCKGILRQLKMAHSNEIILQTIRIILDDEATTELSPLHQLDIHLVAHAMKWAIRHSEEILVTYEDYQNLYVNQDRNFSSFVRDIPPTNRAILLDLFSLCADVTLLAHLNDMTPVIVAKSLSLSIMDGPDREHTTFDASYQQRSLSAAACEDLLRAFLRIKTTHDLAKIDQEDEVDENRYICNETRVLKSARLRSHEVVLPSHIDISVPSSAGSTLSGSAGWPTPAGPLSASTPRNYNGNNAGYFDITPQSGSPISHAGGMYGASLSRSQSIAKSSDPALRAMSPSPYNGDDITEYEELMQDQSHLRRLRQERNSFLRPAESIRAESIRRRSVGDMDSIYMMSVEPAAPEDGYDSDPEVCHAQEADEDTRESLIPDFADGLGWDFNKQVQADPSQSPSLDNYQSQPLNKNGVNRSNSASSNASGLGVGGPSHMGSPRSIRDLSKQQLAALRLQQLQDQRQTEFQSFHHALSQQDLPARDLSYVSPSQGSVNSTTSLSRAPSNRAPKPTPSSFNTPRRSRRNSALRRSVTIDPNSIYGRSHRRLESIHADLLARELAHQADRYIVAEDIRAELLRVQNDHQEPSRASSEFSLQMSPQDLERPKSRRPSLFSIGEQHPSSPSQKQPTSVNNSRSFEVISRPKDVEVSVIFTPIASATSPSADIKSKFHESFPERPASPPAAPKRSLTSSGIGRSTPPLLQQSSSFSGISTATSQLSSSESKPKSSGFIRALSSKLRPKQSDDQLKQSKANAQITEAPAAAPAVSFEPPRLELNFFGDSLGSSDLSPSSEHEGQLPPTSAPALMLQTDSGVINLENWKHEAQLSLPIPLVSGSGQQDDRPTGFTGARRSSAFVIGSISDSIREQRRITKKGSSPALTAFRTTTSSKSNGTVSTSSKADVEPQARSSDKKGTISDSSFPTTDDSGSAEESTRGSAESSIPKTGASEKEYRFSTATLLKDGKLYHQLQWEEFSNLGFKSDIMTEPEQTMSGVHQLRTSQEDPRKQSTSATAASMSVNQRQQNNQMRISVSSSRNPSVDLPGQLGQASRTSTQEPGPSPAQKAVALRVAQESFIALANDSQALEALKEKSASGNRQPTIISSGSFAKDSTLPILDHFPRPPVITSKATLLHQKQQSLEITSMDGEEQDKLQRSMSAKSSLTSSATEAAHLPDSKTMKQLGPVAVGGGGHGSSVSLSSGPRPGKPASIKAPYSPEIKPKGARRFFGKKSKKGSNAASTFPSSSNGGRKRRMFPVGVRRQDVMTKTIESMDEVFPWMCIEHMAGQESGWVMLEPVQDGAVGWVMVDKLEDDMKAPNTRPHEENLREQLQVA